MTVRPLDMPKDFPMLVEWWQGHGAPVMPEQVFLPAKGFVACNPDPVAAGFLFCVPSPDGGIGMIEFVTTNPAKSLSRGLVNGVKALYHHLEQVAWEIGCGSVLSYVKPGSGISRILDQSGYQDLKGDAHTLYGKAFAWPSHS